MSGIVAGGGTFASGALHGVAFAVGAKPVGKTRPIAVADATDKETIRRVAAISHLPKGEPSH
jgi:hypothetical protein